MAITLTPKPCSLFFQAENNPVTRVFHCPWCLTRLFDTNGRLAMVVDNPGPSDQFFVEYKCRNSQCQQVWRSFGPPPPVEQTYVVTVNGVPM